MADTTTVPEYRTVVGQYSDDFGRILQITDPKLAFTGETRVRWGVAELEELSRRNGTLTIQEPALIAILRQHLKVEVTKYTFSASTLVGVLASIRSKLVDHLCDHEVAIRRLPAPSISHDHSRAGVLHYLRDHIVGAVVTVLSGLLVGYLIFRFGWL